MNMIRSSVGDPVKRTALRNLGFRKALGRACVAAAFLVLAAAGAEAGDAKFKATYAISVGSFTIGRVQAETRLTSNGYAAAISGSTSGITRLVSDARASLIGSGRILGTRVLPAAYNLDTDENGFQTHVRMAMNGGAITNVTAVPGLKPSPDRVPIKPFHKRNIVDPVGAFLTVLDRPGEPDGRRACNRTVKVFDGWQRYDIRLFYKSTRKADGAGAGGYSGDLFVCGARYVPVAGHRQNRDSVKSMVDNQRLEVWLAPVAETRYLLPYRIQIGTKYGDLVIRATEFKVDNDEHRASADGNAIR
jgi:hypothetical protein